MRKAGRRSRHWNLLERLRERVDTGQRVGASALIGLDGKAVVNPGIPVTIPRNQDGPEAATVIEDLEAQILKLERILARLRERKRMKLGTEAQPWVDSMPETDMRRPD